MKTYVIGDIHGAHKALVQCLTACNFDYDNDKLICLGDVCDGYPDVKECFDELLKIKNLVYILGNHDDWALQWMKSKLSSDMIDLDHTWYFQGGKWTLQSYCEGVPDSHFELLKNAKLYHKVDNTIFVHGGFDTFCDFEMNNKIHFIWDRSLLMNGYENSFDKVFVGHATVSEVKFMGNIIGIDTGAGHGMKLTIMDIETHEIYQSDLTKDLYEDHQPRG